MDTVILAMGPGTIYVENKQCSKSFRQQKLKLQVYTVQLLSILDSVGECVLCTCVKT